jgi:hypothetical protein
MGLCGMHAEVAFCGRDFRHWKSDSRPTSSCRVFFAPVTKNLFIYMPTVVKMPPTFATDESMSKRMNLQSFPQHRYGCFLFRQQISPRYI